MGSEEKWYGECHHGITVKNGCWRCENEDLRRQLAAKDARIAALEGEVERMREAFAWLESDIRYVDAANILAKLEEWLTYCQKQGKEPT